MRQPSLSEKLLSLAGAAAELDELYATTREPELPVLRLTAELHAHAFSRLEEQLRGTARVLRGAELPADSLPCLSATFSREIAPLLTPIAVGAGHPSPRLPDRAVTVVARIEGGELVFVPGLGDALPRFVQLGAGSSLGFVPREDVVRLQLSQLFARRVAGAWAVRAKRRDRRGRLVRLEHERGLPRDVRAVFTTGRVVTQASDSLLGLTDLVQLADTVAFIENSRGVDRRLTAPA